MANQYKQMIGRAGRAGLSDYGESFLLFKSIEKKKVYDLISLPMKRCESSVIYLDTKYCTYLLSRIANVHIFKTSFNFLKYSNR
jgi:POLQ-like helicase